LQLSLVLCWFWSPFKFIQFHCNNNWSLSLQFQQQLLFQVSAEKQNSTIKRVVGEIKTNIWSIWFLKCNWHIFIIFHPSVILKGCLIGISAQAKQIKTFPKCNFIFHTNTWTTFHKPSLNHISNWSLSKIHQICYKSFPSHSAHTQNIPTECCKIFAEPTHLGDYNNIVSF
jgi:hypothetical protein